MFDIKCEDGYQNKGGLMAPSQCQYPHSLPPLSLCVHLNIFSFMLMHCIYGLLLLTHHVIIPLHNNLHSSLCNDHLIHTNSPRCKDSFNVSAVLCIHVLHIFGGILSSMNALPSPLSCLSPISSESDEHGEELQCKCECDRMWP